MAVRLAPAAPPPPPSPEAKREPAWCRALGTHAWHLRPPMVLVSASIVRVTLACERCASERVDRWHRTKGGIEGRHYAYDDGYGEILDQKRETVRVGLMDTAKPRALSAHVQKTLRGGTHGTEDSRLRLVSKKKAARGHKSS